MGKANSKTEMIEEATQINWVKIDQTKLDNLIKKSELMEEPSSLWQHDHLDLGHAIHFTHLGIIVVIHKKGKTLAIEVIEGDKLQLIFRGTFTHFSEEFSPAQYQLKSWGNHLYLFSEKIIFLCKIKMAVDFEKIIQTEKEKIKEEWITTKFEENYYLENRFMNVFAKEIHLTPEAYILLNIDQPTSLYGKKCYPPYFLHWKLNRQRITVNRFIKPGGSPKQTQEIWRITSPRVIIHLDEFDIDIENDALSIQGYDRLFIIATMMEITVCYLHPRSLKILKSWKIRLEEFGPLQIDHQSVCLDVGFDAVFYLDEADQILIEISNGETYLIENVSKNCGRDRKILDTQVKNIESNHHPNFTNGRRILYRSQHEKTNVELCNLKNDFDNIQLFDSRNLGSVIKDDQYQRDQKYVYFLGEFGISQMNLKKKMVEHVTLLIDPLGRFIFDGAELPEIFPIGNLKLGEKELISYVVLDESLISVVTLVEGADKKQKLQVVTNFNYSQSGGLLGSRLNNRDGFFKIESNQENRLISFFLQAWAGTKSYVFKIVLDLNKKKFDYDLSKILLLNENSQYIGGAVRWVQGQKNQRGFGISFSHNQRKPGEKQNLPGEVYLFDTDFNFKMIKADFRVDMTEANIFFLVNQNTRKLYFKSPDNRGYSADIIKAGDGSLDYKIIQTINQKQNSIDLRAFQESHSGFIFQDQVYLSRFILQKSYLIDVYSQDLSTLLKKYDIGKINPGRENFFVEWFPTQPILGFSVKRRGKDYLVLNCGLPWIRDRYFLFEVETGFIHLLYEQVQNHVEQSYCLIQSLDQRVNKIGNLDEEKSGVKIWKSQFKLLRGFQGKKKEIIEFSDIIEEGLSKERVNND